MIYFKRIGIFILFALFQGSIQEEKQRDGKGKVSFWYNVTHSLEVSI